MIRIHYHRSKCIGCNGCVEANPERWRVSRKDGRCTLVGGEQRKNMFVALVPYEELVANELAAKNCPVNVIRVEEVYFFCLKSQDTGLKSQVTLDIRHETFHISISI